MLDPCETSTAPLGNAIVSCAREPMVLSAPAQVSAGRSIVNFLLEIVAAASVYFKAGMILLIALFSRFIKLDSNASTR